MTILTQENIERHLSEQGLGDASKDLARIVWEHALSWKVEAEGDLNKCDYIFAFAFGFRWNPSQLGIREPGSVNEALAEQVRHYYKQKARHVYAQWEISALLQGAIPTSYLHSISPEVDESGREPYLSTKGVLEKIDALLKKEKKKSAELGSVLIVAHKNHLPRCKWFAEQMGFTVAGDQENMPSHYDSQCAQRWITETKRGIISEVISRLSAYRSEVLYREQP